MPTCQGKLSDGKPCPKIVTEGQTFCRWHNPKDENWRDDFACLEVASPEQKRDIVIRLIDDHPEHLLCLPGQYGFHPNLSYVNLTSVNLQKAILISANLQGAILIHTNFHEAQLQLADLRGAELMAATLTKASLLSANLQEVNLNSANLQNAVLRYANLKDVDFSDVKDLTNAYFSDGWLDRTRMRMEQLGGAFGEEIDKSYYGAKRGYLALKQNFDELGDYDAASWAYRKERRMEKLEARENGRFFLKGQEIDIYGRISIPSFKRRWTKAVENCIKYISDTFIEWLCDYGESIWRVIGWMAFLLLIGGPFLFSILGGFTWPGDVLDRYFSLPSSAAKFWFTYRQYLLYTLDTMTTANFSGLQPGNDAVKLASGFFAIAGIFLTGLLGFVAGNRIRRS